MPGPFLIAKTVPAGTVPITKAQGGRMNVAKAAKLMAVYDANGQLVGMIDPKDLVEVQQATATDANAAKVQQQHDQQAQAAQDVTKACAEALAGLKPRLNAVKKASWAGVTVKDGFADLVKSLDPGRQTALKAAVSHQSMKLMTGFGMGPQQAISQVKKVAVQVARTQGLI